MVITRDFKLGPVYEGVGVIVSGSFDVYSWMYRVPGAFAFDPCEN